jgi:hypothetical protein
MRKTNLAVPPSKPATPTIGRLEAIDSDEPIGGRPETGQALIAALEKAGVEFEMRDRPGAARRNHPRRTRKILSANDLPTLWRPGER